MNKRILNFAVFHISLITSVHPHEINKRDSQTGAIQTTTVKPDKTDSIPVKDCGDGQILEGESCVDINECLEETGNNCGNAICNDIDGGFYCSCPDGTLIISNAVSYENDEAVIFECCNDDNISCSDYYDYSDEEDCSKDWLELGRDFIISLYTQILDLFLTVDGYNSLFRGVNIEDEFSVSNETSVE